MQGHVGAQPPQPSPPHLNISQLVENYKQGTHRMFFLDYDGTLSPIVAKPEDAFPSEELKRVLQQLTSDERNCVYIISGRDRRTLGGWLGELRVGMSAEHGCFVRPLSSTTDGALPQVGQWKDVVQEEHMNVSWKEEIIRLFDAYKTRIPGSLVESKEYAVTFHYRQCTNKQACKPLVRELRSELEELVPRYSNLQALKGRKSVEARLSGISKGFIVNRILNAYDRSTINFVFCAGDDLTDEDMFRELDSDHALRGVFTCTVNFKGSRAHASVEHQGEVMGLLTELARISQEERSAQ